jgi:hypothetical protein
VLSLGVRFLESGGVKYGLTCSKADSLLNHAKPIQTYEATRLVSHICRFLILVKGGFCWWKST